MTGFWILILNFIFMNTVEPGGRWVSAQSLTESPVYQPDKELSVDIGDSATLRCCVSKEIVGIIAWFKQPTRKKPETMVMVYKSDDQTFSVDSQNSRLRIETHGSCFNTMISKTIESDEAMYYCTLTSPNIVFGDGTYLKIKGNVVSSSKPALYDNSVVCEPTLHENATNMNTQKKPVLEMNRSLHWLVLGLGSALGLCVLLIFCLTYFLLRRRKCDQVNTSIEDPPGMRQDSEDKVLTYAALQFAKRKAKAEKRKTGLSEDCVYTDVRHNCMFDEM